MAQPLVTNIQKYAIHDGQGIRSTVFFKGCPLRCAWCHNPETQAYEVEWMHYPERCIHCGRCDDGCPTGAREPVGKHYSVEALAGLLLRDRVFFDVSGGGVTLSGGEVMVQDIGYVLALCKVLHQRGVSITIDTCGHVPYAHFAALNPYVDTYLYDIKMMDPAQHALYTGVDNALILENLCKLNRDGAHVVLRLPIIPGVNDGRDTIAATVTFLQENTHVQQVHLLAYHRLGHDKAHRMQAGAGAALFDEPTGVQMEAIRQVWLEAGFPGVMIGG